MTADTSPPESLLVDAYRQGLEHLRGLTQLKDLNLNGMRVITDVGLEHLEGLTQLQELGIIGTRVTDEGVKKLRQALPDCKIDR